MPTYYNANMLDWPLLEMTAPETLTSFFDGDVEAR